MALGNFTPKRLYSGTASGASATIYTTSATGGAVIKRILLVNTNGNGAASLVINNAVVLVSAAAGAIADKNGEAIALNAGDILQIIPPASGSCQVYIGGVEFTV